MFSFLKNKKQHPNDLSPSQLRHQTTSNTNRLHECIPKNGSNLLKEFSSLCKGIQVYPSLTITSGKPIPCLFGLNQYEANLQFSHEGILYEKKTHFHLIQHALFSYSTIYTNAQMTFLPSYFPFLFARQHIIHFSHNHSLGTVSLNDSACIFYSSRSSFLIA